MSVLCRNSRIEGDVMANETREVMNVRQAAKYLQINVDTLYTYAIKGQIPAFKLGNRWRFKLSHVDQWMDAQANSKSAVRP